MSRSRRSEAVSIWLSHGLADSLTTVAAYRAVGSSREANPVIRELLGFGELATVLVILLAVGLCALAWPTAARSVRAPPAVATGIVFVGMAVAGINTSVALGWI